jgi:hypothetical protein
MAEAVEAVEAVEAETPQIRHRIMILNTHPCI